MSSMSTDRGPNSDSGAFLAAKQGIEKAMRHVVEGERQKEAGEDLVLDTLKRVAQDYRLWTRRVVTVRTLQTITVLELSPIVACSGASVATKVRRVSIASRAGRSDGGVRERLIKRFVQRATDACSQASLAP